FSSFYLLRLPLCSTLFPYTTLFRSVHFAFVAFVVAGFILIWVGFFLRWSFVRDTRFRLAHLLAMAFVLGESLLGLICPLTTWEEDRKSTRLNSSHVSISYAVFCLKK